MIYGFCGIDRGFLDGFAGLCGIFGVCGRFLVFKPVALGLIPVWSGNHYPVFSMKQGADVHKMCG